MTDGWAPCSDRSLERDDPLGGSAGFGERWFLVEIDGAWGTHAILQSRLDPDIARLFVTRVEGARMRPLAIRRTGRRADERRAQSRWRWAIVDARPGSESVRWGEVDDPALLLDVPLDGSTGTPSDAPIIAVCTHARHDQCCAVRGRPVVAAIAKAFPKQTWECSHLGGDRFAATMIVFPHGFHFGRVPADHAVEIVDRYLAGEVDARHLRGRSSLPNVVQAAQAFAAGADGNSAVSAHRPLAHRRLDAAGERRWSVDLEGTKAGEVVTLELGERMSAPILSTCAATHAAPVREFELLALSRRTPG